VALLRVLREHEESEGERERASLRERGQLGRIYRGERAEEKASRGRRNGGHQWL
jgi:hypothetical protein